MNVLTLKAHYAGEKICLDEPFDLSPDTPLVVAVFTPDDEMQERADWIALAKKALEAPTDPMSPITQAIW